MKFLSIILVTLSISFNVKSQTISSGSYYSLFICPDEKVTSTGANNFGQLGNGTNNPQLLPVIVSGLSDVIAVSAGQNHSLFLRNDGTVWACGYNAGGQLGDGTNINRNIPVQINSLSNIIAISVRGMHSLFLKDDGTVWACGVNEYGQLGDGTNINRNTPVQINGLSNIVAVAGGTRHSLFIKSDGTVWACGYNVDSQLGNEAIVYASNVPVQVSGLSNVIAAAGGGEHSLFLKSDGTVWACGKNTYEQLGNDTTAYSYKADTPVQVVGLSNIKEISAGALHSLFLRNDGTAWACGRNWEGQLGDGTTINKSIPIQVAGLSNIAAIASGYWCSLFLNDDNSIWATGNNTEGQFGNGTNTGSLSPIQVISQLNCRELGISEITSSNFEIDVFPNPFEDEIRINYSIQKEVVTMDMYITDMQGRIITEYSPKTVFPGQHQSVISLKEFAPGNYLLWGHLNGEVYYKNIVKK
ncbi:MAG: T9SS type A sorting domain-containing protein [Crocinitomicaceae bacterium]|nr:T9SS type A sorting domain-containing protein [Crocinitomicaceae bacterium]